MSSVSADPVTTDAVVAKRGAWMAVGRIADQGALGLAGLVLAARLSVSDYAPVALILVAHSVAGTLGDLGLAHEMLRLQPGQKGPRRLLRAVRVVNLVCVAVALLAAVMGWAVAAAAVGLWALNSEAMLRQSATMLAGAHRRLGLVQAFSAAVFAVAVVVGAHGAAVLGAMLCARTLLELLLLPTPERFFGSGQQPVTELKPLPVLVTHGIGFGNRNIDFLVGAPFLGTAGFARYVFAYRLANAGFAPVGAIATRLGISELAGHGDEIGRRYRRGLLLLFGGGLVAAVLTAVGALVVPFLVGERWADAVPLILLLTVALPFRFIDGVISPLLYVSGNHDNAIRLEVARLAVIVVAVAVGALFGVQGLAIAMSGATIATVWAGHRWAGARAAIEPPRWLDHSGLAALAILAVGGWLL